MIQKKTIALLHREYTCGYAPLSGFSEWHCHYGFWYDNGFVIAALLLLSFGIISNFGLVTVISVFFALIGANIVMPGIPVLAGRFEQNPETD